MPDEDVTGQDQADQSLDLGNSGDSGDSLNPAWNDLLEVVPSQLHSQVTPLLSQWDKNYQESLQKVHSQYDPYKPYVENQIAPDQINYALQLMQAIETRPADVLAALQQYTGDQNQPQGSQTGEQGQIDDEIPNEFANHPEFQRINKMVETMAQLLVQQGAASQESQEDAALSQELDELHEKHGDFDEEWVLTKALNNPNAPLETHVAAYKQFVTGILQQQRAPGPKILGAGGIAPNNQGDIKSLDDAGRRGLVAQMLQNAAQQQ